MRLCYIMLNKTKLKAGRRERGRGNANTSSVPQRRLDSRPQSIMGIERLIPRVTSLTVDCRGVNISLTKPIWKLSNDKSVSPYVKESGFRNPTKICASESGIHDVNPESIDSNPESIILIMEYGIQVSYTHKGKNFNTHFWATSYPGSP